MKSDCLCPTGEMWDSPKNACTSVHDTCVTVTANQCSQHNSYNPNAGAGVPAQPYCPSSVCGCNYKLYDDTCRAERAGVRYLVPVSLCLGT